MTDNKDGIVVCKLPKAGLGNQLFPLMRAATFAHLNNLSLVVTNYHQLKPGPWLRRERTKRMYAGFFTFQKNIVGETLDKWKLKNYYSGDKIYEPEISVFERPTTNCIFLFKSMPHYTQYFDGLHENRKLVKELLWKMISSAIKKRVENCPSPFIGVHIRMGDFRKLRDDEQFGQAGNVRTPESYFIEIINSLRTISGSDLPASIFSDGKKANLQDLFNLSNIKLVEGNNDLEDLLILSKSKIIVVSAGSTFSYWAGFLSDSIVLVHPTYTSILIRRMNENGTAYIGAYDDRNEQLKTDIRQVKFTSYGKDLEK